RPHTLPTHYCVCRFVSLLPTLPPLFFPSLFFFNVPAPSEIYTLSLHDALPILHYAVHACLVLIHRLRRFSLRRYCQPHWSRVDPDRKSTRLNSSHVSISYAVFCLKKKTEGNI